MCTFLLSFITWEKSLSTHANVNRCLRSEEIDSSFCQLAFKRRPPWNRVNKVFLVACNQARMPSCPSRSDELTDRHSPDFLSIVTYLSNEANSEEINLLAWSEINVMLVDASGNVLFSLSLYLSVASILIIKYLFVWHTDTHWPSIAIWSCHKSRWNPKWVFAACLRKLDRFPSSSLLFSLAPTNATDTRENAASQWTRQRKEKEEKLI